MNHAETETTRLGRETAEHANYFPLIVEIDAQEMMNTALNKNGS